MSRASNFELSTQQTICCLARRIFDVYLSDPKEIFLLAQLVYQFISLSNTEPKTCEEIDWKVIQVLLGNSELLLNGTTLRLLLAIDLASAKELVRAAKSLPVGM